VGGTPTISKTTLARHTGANRRGVILLRSLRTACASVNERDVSIIVTDSDQDFEANVVTGNVLLLTRRLSYGDTDAHGAA